MTDLGSIYDIPPGEGRAYPVDGETIAVFRLRDGSVRALTWQASDDVAVSAVDLLLSRDDGATWEPITCPKLERLDQ